MIFGPEATTQRKEPFHSRKNHLRAWDQTEHARQKALRKADSSCSNEDSVAWIEVAGFCRQWIVARTSNPDICESVGTNQFEKSSVRKQSKVLPPLL